MLKSFLLLLLAMVVGACRSGPGLGVDCNYQLGMEGEGRTWRHNGSFVNPLHVLKESGVESARVRLWVGENGESKFAYAAETARRAKLAGLRPYLVIFLSDQWADFVKQPVPEVWKNFSLEKKAAAVEEYAADAVARMRAAGVEFELFEIGNEIDFGICGEFEEEWAKRVSVEYMRQKVWPRMLPVIKAAQAGVRRVQPGAKFILHLTQWNNAEYCVAFWKFMLENGAQLDYAGLSYFPTSAEKAEQRGFAFLKKQAAEIRAAVGRKIVICETGYPAAADFGGQFAAWKNPADGFPLSPEGQAKWIAAFSAMIASDENFAGGFYWSPEWYGGGIWDAFALFDSAGNARAGATAFSR